MAQGFRRMMQYKKINKNLVGFMRATEVTINNKDNSYNQHMHVLVCVEPTYFKNTENYVNQKQWIQFWKKAMKLDYDPNYYLRYNLSYREVQEILYDRGINVSLLYQIWKKKNKKSFYSWKMDETYIKIKGKWHYLYRAIDADGLTLDIWLRKKRDTQAAYAFLKRLVKQFDEPKVVVTDKAPSITSAFKKLKEYGFYQGTEHRTIKYLNNLIEQDHRPVKRRNKFYRSLRTASTTIKGMEAIRGLYKKTRKEGTLFGFSVCTEIKVLLGIPA